MGLISSSGSTFESMLQLIGVLLIFIVILAATYATTRWIANYQKTTNNNRNIKIIETARVTNNKYIQIVQVGEKYLAIAVTKDNITVLAELSKDEIIQFSAENQIKKEASFSAIIDKFKNNKLEK